MAKEKDMKEKETKEKELTGTRGERLKRIRKSKGLTLEQVHQGTKIHMGMIRAIEDDALGEMAPTYLKGLLKIYCAFLGVDVKDFIEEYYKEESKQRTEATEHPQSQESIPLAEPKIRISLAKRRINKKPIIIIICLLVLGIVVFNRRKNISTTIPAPVGLPAVSKPAVPEPAANNPRLGIRAKEDCWLEVKSDGKTIFKGILKKGRSDFWEARKRIEFTVGSAGVIEVEVNNRVLPPLGRRGQVIRNILVTKEGLIAPE